MKYVFANWKMYLDVHESVSLATAISSMPTDKEKVQIALFPGVLPFVSVQQILGTTHIALGAQDVHPERTGAYTSKTSADIFAKAGASYALVGHSERRYLFGDTDEIIADKLAACVKAGIVPVLCVGETLDMRKAGNHEACVFEQIKKGLSQVDIEDTNFIIAYEPIWAISQGGVGKGCDPQEAAQMHTFIKKEMAHATKNEVRVLYGGSVRAENVLSYVSQDTIDGVLLGHASTNASSLQEIINTVSEI